MVASEKDLEAADESRRKLIIVVAVVAALVIAGVFYFLMRASSGGNVEPTLEAAIRPGSTEWDQNHSKIVLDTPEADEAKRALGDIVMNLQSTVRNFTGRTLNGLEIKGAVVNHDGKPVKERTVIVIPGREPELQPNRTMLVTIRLEGMTEKDDRASIRMEVTGFKFKQ
ncbi:MAG TPA: hypothetical protein VFH31_09265 [Pyrinomonadaceae bacterium]|nr:hypothetical protein [Pyrinomonadaceae bacterium]